jgi:hypothetical protein
MKNFSSGGKAFHQEDFLFCLAVQAFEYTWYNKAQQNARSSKGKMVEREEDPQSCEQTTTEYQSEPSQSDMEVEPTFQQVSTPPPSKNSKKKAKKQRTVDPPPPSNSGKSITQKSKSPDNPPDKIITDNNIPKEATSNIRNIIIYDVPVTWSPKKILNELTGWGITISYTTKKQHKYQTLLVKIALSSFTLASYEQGL